MVSGDRSSLEPATGRGKRELMRRTSGANKLFFCRTVLRVAEIGVVAGEWEPTVRFLVRVESQDELEKLASIATAGMKNLAVLTREPRVFESSNLPSVLEAGTSLEAGDVVAVTPNRRHVQVLFRESDTHHTVFLTNRCNSYCIMCSQPPTSHDDAWLVDEAVEVAAHMRISPRNIGFTGGEPLLLGGHLRKVLDAFARYHPGIEMDMLSNGRLLSHRDVARAVLDGMDHVVTWMIPLYGHADFLHDFIVQTPGAFDQTIEGLLALRAHRQSIQLRTVLIEPVLEVLLEFCEFVGRNLPFVREVALMGCEPTGFALANREMCEVDVRDWSATLEEAVRRLRRAGLVPVLMNTPLCGIPQSLWPYAHQSISDWKRVFAPECDDCAVRNRCSGLFAWYEKGWRPTTLKPFEEALA